MIDPHLLQSFKVGDRVFARCDIFFANTGHLVTEGTRGTVEIVRVHQCAALVFVQFDDAPIGCTTSVENLAPLLS